MISYDDVYDIISIVRVRVADEELEVEEALNLIESEISLKELEDIA